ncbi:hypothetical protein KBD69_02455 [Candidatus Woesebacteria bacterium]|nr:hypothetical protein [Candidatus Woesebacteria bacterium]
MIFKSHSREIFVEWAKEPIHVPGGTVTLAPVLSAYFFSYSDASLILDTIDAPWQKLARTAIRELDKPLVVDFTTEQLAFIYAPIGFAKAVKYISHLRDECSAGITHAYTVMHEDPNDTWKYLLTLYTNQMQKVPIIKSAQEIPENSVLPIIKPKLRS